MQTGLNGMAEAWMWAAMEPEPTESDKQLLDLFAVEYMADECYTSAALRCGFGAGFAADYGLKFLQRPYVQRKLQMLRMQEPAPAQEKDERTWQRRRNIALLNEIAGNKMQKAASRVAAIRELNALHGFHAPTKVAVSATHKGGVFLVPGTADVSEWEKAAAETQDALAHASRVD